MAWTLLLLCMLCIDVAASLPMGSLPLALAHEGESTARVSLVMGAAMFASEERRVSSIATLGIIGNFAMAVGPASAVWLWQHGVGRAQYVYADISIVLGLLLLFTLPARHDIRSSRRSRLILMRSAWLPAFGFCMAAQLQGGINGALAVLTFHNRGIVNGALLFSAAATTVILLRYPAGRFVDVYGPRLVAIPTAIFQATGCVIASLAWTPYAVITAGIFLGMAWSAVIPIGVALFYEKSSRSTRGVAMGAYNFAGNLGSATGALIAAATATLGPGYTLAMLIASVAPLASLPYLMTSQPQTRRLLDVQPAAQST